MRPSADPPASVDFYFDVVCPYAYLAHTQVEEVCRQGGADLVWKPVLLGGVFREVGNGPDGRGPMPTMPDAKARLNLLDMQRWAELRGVPLRMPTCHPARSVVAMRTILASGDTARAAKALFASYWRDSQNVADEHVLQQALDGAGFDGAALLARAVESDVKQALHDRVDEAVAAGVFGVPTLVVRGGGRADALFWGQDRFDWIARELEARH